MQYISEVKKMVRDYSSIKKSLAILDEQARLLTLQKNHIELELAQLREAELLLIDKIKQETGSEPDFYQIIQGLNEESVHVD